MMNMLRCPTCGRKHTRSNEQNKLYWAMLHEVEDQLKPNGHQYSADSWHIYFKKRFLGADDVRLPNGMIHSQPKSTASLDSDRMSEYIMKVEEFATKYGVIINHE